MMKEVESGKVGTILIKDMSRMGRDYLKVGQYMELLRQKNVRLIAVNENVDSFREDDDFTPFRNIMNEWYARDTSKKIKSTFKAKGKSGKHVASTTPYGYLKDKREIGFYGSLHRNYLKDYKSGLYSYLTLSGKLWTYLADLNEQCLERRDFLMEQIMEQEGITEELKSRDQMEWVRRANNARSRVDEIILNELVYV